MPFNAVESSFDGVCVTGSIAYGKTSAFEMRVDFKFRSVHFYMETPEENQKRISSHLH